jgi:hypothetical protein
MVRRGSIGDSSDNDFSDAGGGSDTDAGSGVTGDDGADTSFGGSGPDTGDSTDTDSSGGDPSDSGGFDGGGGGGGDDDDSDVTDRDTTYSGGGSSTTAPSGATGGGTETTFEGGGGDETTTQAPEGETGTDDPTQPADPSGDADDLPADLPEDALDDADRGFSVTRQPNQLEGGQLEQSERAVEASREEQAGSTQRLEGLEDEYGALSGKEGALASQVQQLQARIDRETELDAFLDTEDYAIRRQGDRLVTEFAPGVGRDDPSPVSSSERRAQIAEEIAADRAGVSPDDVTVTATASGYQAVIGDGSNRTVVTGGPGQERVETEVRVGETGRGIGITSGPAGGSVVLPGLTAAEAGRRGQRQLDAQRGPEAGDVRADVTQYGQVQLDRSRSIRRGGDTFAVGRQGDPISPSDQLSVQSLINTPVRSLQTAGRRRERAVINTALEETGINSVFQETIGVDTRFREYEEAGQSTGYKVEESPADLSEPYPALAYTRGAGRRREQRFTNNFIESTNRRDVAAAATAGVAAPEPVSTVGGAIVLGTLGAAAVASESELEVPEEQDASELSIPEEQQPGELEAPEQRPGEVSELDTPENQQRTFPELDVPSRESPAPMTIRTAELIGRQRGRQRQEEDEGPLDDTTVPERFIPDEERTLGEEEQTTEPELSEELDEPESAEEQYDFVRQQEEEQTAAEEQTQPELDEQTDPFYEQETGTATGAGGVTEPLFIPGTGVRDRLGTRTRTLTETDLGTRLRENPRGDTAAVTAPMVGVQPLQDLGQTPQQSLSLDQTSQQEQELATTTAVAQQAGFPALTEPVLQQLQEPEVGAPNYGFDVPDRTPRPRFGDENRPRRSEDLGTPAATDVAGSDALAPNWVNQTFQTIALEGRVDEPVPTEGDVEEPGTALPAGVEVFGTEEEQDQFESVSAFFSFGGLR